MQKAIAGLVLFLTLTLAGFQSDVSGPQLPSSPLMNSIGGDVALNAATYTDGPSAAQGTSGTWGAIGTVIVTDTGAAPLYNCKLWDGTTLISSGRNGGYGAANVMDPLTLSGFIASPGGNIRISCISNASPTVIIKANASGLAKDSTIFVWRIN